jgi:hypothetical protein
MISIISVLSLTREQGQIEGLKKKFSKGNYLKKRILADSLENLVKRL